MDDKLFDLLIARVTLRIVIVCGGILSLYLGYRLFMKSVGGESGFEASHNKTKLKLAKAAPGVFFALFGAPILIMALTRSLEIKLPSGQVYNDLIVR